MSRSLYKLALGAVYAAAMVLSSPSLAADLPFAGTGKSAFSHEDVSPRGTVALTVETYVPAQCAAKACPLVMSMHGLARDAAAARDNWVAAADANGLVVAAPLFDKERFPTRLYQLGGVRDEPDRARWIYAVIERLFDRLTSTGRVDGDRYVLFGHSAGAQFVHRMVLMMPEARFSTAISANAGYYTLPVAAAAAGGRAYPYSISGTPATEDSLRRSFARPLLILLGDRDDDPKHHQLNTGEGASAQGPHRFARGQHFVQTAEAEAHRLGATYAWQTQVVPGVAHEQAKMARAAALRLFGK